MIDLFCGAGGFTRGFVDVGFRPVFANDHDAAAVASYRANFDPDGEHAEVADLTVLLEDPSFELPAADVVVGGPPCQGFSLLNKQRLGDVRRDLWRPYLEVVRRAGADVFVMENVPQLLRSHELEDLKRMARSLGFAFFEARKLCAADHGAPTVRHRAIVLASRVGPVRWPRPTHARSGTELPPWRTVRDAMGDLDDVPVVGTEIRDVPPPGDLHFGRRPTAKSRERYRAVPPGGNRFDLQANRPDITPACWIRKTSGGTDLFGRLWWDRPSVTIRTEFFKPEKGRYLHPVQHRPITHREAARLQGFPDGFRFRGKKTEIARQIGNAVPPPLSSALAREVADALDRRTSTLSTASASERLTVPSPRC
jgi:DNA (cytosine-5)-methyltransferase 1